MNKDVLILLIACRQISSSIYSDIFEEIENIKTSNRIPKTSGPTEYIILKLSNEYDNVIKDLIIELEIKVMDYNNNEFRVIPSSLKIDLKSRERLEISLFEIGGFKKCNIYIKNLNYIVENKLLKDFVGGNNYQLNISDLQDPNGGFISYYKR